MATTYKYRLSIITNATRDTIYKHFFAYVFGVSWPSATTLINGLTSLAVNELGQNFIDNQILPRIEQKYDSTGGLVFDITTSNNREISLNFNEPNLNIFNFIIKRTNKLPVAIKSLAPASPNLNIVSIKLYKVKITEVEVDKTNMLI